MITLGLNYLGLGHDSAAAIALDGKIIYAIAEERLTRVKQDASFPINAIKNCLKFADVKIDQVDEMVFGWPSLDKYHMANIKLITKGHLSSSISVEMLNYYRSLTTRNIKNYLKINKLNPKKITYINHHLAHALSVLPYLKQEESLIFIIDGRGTNESTSVYHKIGLKLELLNRINFPNSFGVFYSEMTSMCGFRKLSDEWKVMGLAPYGKNIMNLDSLISSEGGKYEVNHKKLLDVKELNINGKQIYKREDEKESIDDTEIKDLAYSTQHYYEKAILSFVGYYVKKYNINSVGIAGGVGLNCKANGYLFRELNLNEIFIQPAATDDGTALGAAVYPNFMNGTLTSEDFDPYLGNEYEDNEIKEVLDRYNLNYKFISKIECDAANELKNGKVIGWFQGRDEFGPRALGNRSILSDPRNLQMKSRVNDIVKYRENWRPFAPSLLVEYANDVLKHVKVSPYMILTDYVTEEYVDKIPAVVHVDKTLRPQTVDKKMNNKYWKLIDEFRQLTGVPVLMNTSFNLKGEPNVSNPTDAVRTFFTSGLDLLYIGNFKVLKK